jgi:uncharacterized RDD family membrane protein YckC
MSSTPPPPGYEPGDYVPFKDRDPANPSAVAGEPGWAEQVRAQNEAYVAANGPVDPYRALYGADAPIRTIYASWGKRVLAYLVDSLFGALFAIPAIIGYVQIIGSAETTTDAYGTQTASFDDVSSTSIGLLAIGLVLSLLFGVYNVYIRQGRTGYTFGKTVVGIKLVSEATRQPVGPLMAFVRSLAHIVDGFCYVGYLWPIWDAKNQTFADKIMNTIVVVQPQDHPTDPAGYAPH